ncbi:P-loop NTPase fold protein [uncultured Desulfovibrio sp.]|uniref:KAP family P-loop NTPase fold protein n=1 Tax=uncultured Desulfovibrio sp. TaxID=167968 RepID=UPI00261F28A9|nr:P-loop NTPase fold protein [uncultured Desulfovibrio sp.]
MDASVSLENITFADRDEFNRKAIAENIIKLLDADVDFCPMVIDGGWGTGKTEFCRKLINLIKEQDAQRQASAQEVTARADRTAAGAAGGAMPGDAASQPAADESRPAAVQAAALPPERAIIYLDAFASETVDDPLLCILAAIRAEFPEEKKKEISRKALPVVKTLGKVAGKAAFAHLFKQDLEEVSEELAEAASEGADALVEQTVDKLLDQYANAQGNIDALKNVMAKAAEERPILFFIDELDRCRPDVALSILELVKHVFDVPGIKFVFVANMQQLKAVIRKRYGQDVDADVYLEKFVNLSINIPSVHIINHQSAASILLKNEFNDIEVLRKEESFCKRISNHIIVKHNISLRGIEKFVKNIKIYKTIADDFSLQDDNIDSFIFLLSMFIFSFDRDITNKVLNDNIDDSIVKFVGESQDAELARWIFCSVNVIQHGIHILDNKIGLTNSDMYIIRDILNTSDKTFNESNFKNKCFYLKANFINYIRKMNMISIKW